MPRSPLSVRLATLSAFGLLLVAGQASVANAQVTLGVMGDSLSDEYQYNGRAYAQNLVEQLATYDHVNLGASVSNLPPRYIGYNQNWALVDAQRHGSLRWASEWPGSSQIPNAGGYGIDYAALVIGANDFGPGRLRTTASITAPGRQLQINTYVNSVVSNISTALAQFCSRASKRLVATIPDYGITPAVQAGFPDPSKRQLVANVHRQVNTDIKAVAQADHIVVADLSGLISATFGTEGNFHTTVSIGNVPINLTQTTSSTSSQAGFWPTEFIPTPRCKGTLANLMVQALDTGYNAGIPLFSEEPQILSHAGLTYGGSETSAVHRSLLELRNQLRRGTTDRGGREP